MYSAHMQHWMQRLLHHGVHLMPEVAAEGSSRSAMAAFALSVVFLVIVWLWHRRRRALLDMPLVPGPKGLPILGSLLDMLRPDWHHQLLDWANKYGGIYRVQALWFDALVVTDPAAVAAVCGRGTGALDKASLIYMPINQMCSPRAHPNLLTSAADPAWRAIRKAVAVAFSVQNIRKKFPVVRACSQQLLDQLVALSDQARTNKQPPLTVDVDQAALRVTLDVIGMAGFGHDFGCVKAPLSVTQPAPYKHLLRVLPRCFTEVMLRLANPFRSVVPECFKAGTKGEEAFLDFQKEMRTLLRGCLLRDTPPAEDDACIGAQLWRAYNEQRPAPPTLRPTSIPPKHASVQAAANGGTAMQQQSSTGAELAPAGLTEAVASSGGGADDDVTVGGLLRPPPSGLQRFRNRLAQLLASITSRPVTTSTKDDPLISAERILSEIGILFIEGFETTGHSIAWTLYNISTTPGVQERIAAELQRQGLLVSPDNRVSKASVDIETLPRLVYLTACVKEAMRILPVVSVMGRMVGDKPTKVGPYRIPPGTTVGIPLFGIQNSDANWERPRDYIPERWLKVPVESYVVGSMPPLSSCEVAVQERLRAGVTDSDPQSDDSPRIPTSRDRHPSSTHDSADSTHSRSSQDEDSDGDLKTPWRKNTAAPQVRFAPFSEGPRNCVGQTLAKIEVMTFLALLLSHFRVELAPEMGGRGGIRARESTHLTLQTKGTQGIRMILHPRWHTAVTK